MRKPPTLLEPHELGYELVTNPQRAKELIAELNPEELYALDIETTSLRPETGKVRLTQIWNDEVHYVFDHFFCGEFDLLGPKMLGPTYIVFNAGFEGRWFDYVAPEKAVLWDVGLMRKCKLGGGGYSLAEMTRRDFKIDMSKDQQLSDWGADNLTRSQLNYAAFDGYITWELFKWWRRELDDDQFEAFKSINEVWRANVEMEEQGLYLDTRYHSKLIKVWELKKKTALTYFRKWTPESVIKNPNSTQQVSNFLKQELDEDTIASWPTAFKGKHLSLTRDVCTQAAHRLPYPMNRWMAAYIIYRKWNKYTSTYGEKLITIQNMQGVVTSRFNIMQAITGRYSSSNTNLQNIPRQEYIRKAFVSRPVGNRTMVLADYKGIEIRVLAEISDDAQLREDTIYGNVHAAGAATINGYDYDYFVEVLEDSDHPQTKQFKGYRQKAKVFTFRLTYGAGDGTLAISLNCSDDEARQAVEAWAARYPNAYNYRFRMFSEMNHTYGFLPIWDGRTVYVMKPDRTLPVAANYPVQGAAATVMYRALIRVRELLLQYNLDAYLCATIHDEIIIDAHKDDAEKAHVCLQRGMVQGWKDVFPGTDVANMTDSAIGDSWAAKP